MYPIRRESVADLVYEQIMEQIFKGEWVPGSKIPSENELSKRLGVSRISIREAFQRLVSLGILETRQGDGTYVKEFTPGVYMNPLIPLCVLDPVDLMEVMEYRKITEIETIGLAAERATEADIDDLEEIYAKMEASRGDIKELVKNILSLSMSDIVSSLGSDMGLYYHKQLIDTIISRDREVAKKTMEEHIDRTIEALQVRLTR